MGQQRFFEIAATTIPLLLFGTIIARALEPPPLTQRLRLGDSVRSLIAGSLGLFALVAEGGAIYGVAQGNVDTLTRTFVATGVVAGLVGVALAIALPWEARLRAELGSSRFQLFGTTFLVCVVLASAGLTVDGIVKATNSPSAKAQAEARSIVPYEKALFAYQVQSLKAFKDNCISHYESQLLDLYGEQVKLQAIAVDNPLVRPRLVRLEVPHIPPIPPVPGKPHSLAAMRQFLVQAAHTALHSKNLSPTERSKIREALKGSRAPPNLRGKRLHC